MNNPGHAGLAAQGMGVIAVIVLVVVGVVVLSALVGLGLIVFGVVGRSVSERRESKDFERRMAARSKESSEPNDKQLQA